MDRKGPLIKHQKKIKFQVDSKYSILETIGEGAYGVVCSAVNNTNGQRVAIKKICGVFDVPQITKRTLRELKILKHFKHDNIISIKEIVKPPSDDFNDVYLVLDLMGSDLHHIIHSKQELSDEHLRYFLYQLLRGLKYIHSANIIHRDLKPSNLLVNKDCELKIGDFGMARSLSSSPTEQKRLMTEYVATRWYRAPELMLSVHQFTKAIDVWSVGCIFAEMLGRAALFPGSNYLNQLQLILSVVGVPSLEFMSTITSDRVRNYIGRLPHKEPVAFCKIYPEKAPEAIDLLSQFLVLDPRRRVSVEQALNHPFVSKYHDLDDEPTCPRFSYDLETIPLDKNILKGHILKEILEYHSKRPKPKLAPVQTEFLKPFSLPPTKEKSENETLQTILITDSVDYKQENARKRKHKGAITNVGASKKKITDEMNTGGGTVGNELSNEDKELLERWSKMQKDTTPFVHPIRGHMEELLKLKVDTIQQQQLKQQHSTTTQQQQQETITCNTEPKFSAETVKGQKIVNRVCSTANNANNNISTLQFTNLVPKTKDGHYSLVAESTVVLTTAASNIPIPAPRQTTIVNPSVKVSTAISTTTTKDIVVVTVASNEKVNSTTITTVTSSADKQLQSQPKQILVPIGSGQIYQLQGGSQIVIIPNNLAAAQAKVNAPIPIAPKPIQLTGVNMRPKFSTVNTSAAALIKPNVRMTQSVKIAPRVSEVVSNKGTLNSKTNQTLPVLTKKEPKYEYCHPKTESVTTVDVSGAMQQNDISNLVLSTTSSKINESILNDNNDDKLTCQTLFSACSNLTDLSFNSAELSSGDAKLSSEEYEVIAKVKKLDEDDQKIVNIIEEIEEAGCSSEYNGNYDDAKTNSSSQISQPITTVSNTHTDSWSIVKNMLVSTIKARQQKEEQQLQLQKKIIEAAAGVMKNLIRPEYSRKTPERSQITQPDTKVTTGNLPSYEQAMNDNDSRTTYSFSPDSSSGSVRSKGNSVAYDANTDILTNYTNNIYNSNVRNDVMSTQGPVNSFNSIMNLEGTACSLGNTMNIQRSVNSQNNIMNIQRTVDNQNFNMTGSIGGAERIQIDGLKDGDDCQLTGGISFGNSNIQGMSLQTPSITINNPSISSDSNFDSENNEGISQLQMVIPQEPTQNSTSLLSNVNNFFPDDLLMTTLVTTPKTPRSGAGGYGLGMDFEDLFANGSNDLLNTFTLNTQQLMGEQAPPSASLLNEWLGMDELDPADIADLQRELESTSSVLFIDS